MNKFRVIIAVVMLGFLTGCLSTPTTIEEFDANGRITKRTITEESVVKSITEATKTKTIVMWKTGWLFGFQATVATTEDPTPTFKFLGGKQADGYISALKDQTDWDGIAKAVMATNQSLKVDASVTGIGVSESREKSKLK